MQQYRAHVSCNRILTLCTGDRRIGKWKLENRNWKRQKLERRHGHTFPQSVGWKIGIRKSKLGNAKAHRTNGDSCQDAPHFQARTHLASGARSPSQYRLHSPHPERSSALRRQPPYRPHFSVNCSSAESLLRHSQCEPATWTCRHPRKLPLDPHACLPPTAPLTTDSTHSSHTATALRMQRLANNYSKILPFSKRLIESWP